MCTTPVSNASALQRNGPARLLATCSTPLVAGTALVVCLTGAMMFFHVLKGEVEAMHEWLGMAFVLAVMLHAYRHRAPFASLFVQRRTYLILFATLLVSGGFLILSPSKGPNPTRQIVSAVLDAPIVQVAPVLGLSTDEALRRLSSAGAKTVSAAQSLKTIARENDLPIIKLLAAMNNDPAER